MKWEKWGYLITFLCGVLLENYLEIRGVADSNVINRNNMMLLCFDEILVETYFVQILLLRFQTVTVLWILCRFIPERVVILGFGSLISFELGCIVVSLILANGIWGGWFLFCALLPHGMLYVAGFILWNRMTTMHADVNRSFVYANYGNKNIRKERVIMGLLILLLVTVGSFCEAYFTPNIIENVIKS